MLNRKVILVLVVAIIVVMVASGYMLNKRESSNSQADITYESLIEILKADGYKITIVEPGANEVKHTFFSVYPKYIDVGKERVSIYEFNSPVAAANQAKTISRDGYSIGNAQISWIDTPHFYVKGNLIVGYIGRDKTLLNDMKNILGSPVTQQ